jgi:hypothetical protein
MGEVVSAITGEYAGVTVAAVGLIAAAAAVAWPIKTAFVAWRTGSKATNKVGT